MRARVDWFLEFRDADAVLDPGALAEVRALLDAVPDLDADPEVAAAVGWLHWCRYQVLDPGADEQELRMALRLFEPVYRTLPAEVPDPVREFLEDRAHGPGPVGQPLALAAQAVRLLPDALSAGDPAQLDVPIGMLRQALEHTPASDPNRPAMLSFLGIALHRRFALTADPADADDAVACGRQAVRECPPGHPGRAEMMVNLGIALSARAAAGTGEPGDLDDAVSSLEQAVAITPAGSPDRAEVLVNYGTVLWTRAEQADVPGDLDKAIAATREASEAMPADYPARSGTLANLGTALRIRYERTGQPDDVQEAIGILRELTVGAARGEGRPLSNLALALLRRFELTGAQEDLSEALGAAREAVRLTKAGDPDMMTWLANLGVILLARFESTGAPADLDEAITLARQALAATPPSHPSRARWLANLCGSLARRSELGGVLADLDEAIEVAREAVIVTPADNPDYAGLLSNLGGVLARRRERTGDLADLDEAIGAAREAVSRTPAGHPRRPAVLSNLGTALARRSEVTGSLADLDEAIGAMRRAVQATPLGHGDRAMWLSNLGTALARRSALTRSPGDLDEAVTVERQAVEVTPDGHPDQAEWLTGLAAALRTRFERAGAADDLDAAMAAGRKAAASEVASPRIRARAAREWAEAAGTGQRWAEAVDAFEAAIALVGLIAPRSLARRDQEHLLQEMGGLASDAAACCIRVGKAGRAVELFEQGRGILLGQVLDTRTDLTELAAEHPDLAGRFAALRDDLDAAGEHGDRLMMPPAEQDRRAGGDAGPARRELERRRRLAKAFDQVIDEIRATPGFGRFLRPPLVSDLAAAVGDSAVVIVNVSRFGSHALTLAGGELLKPVPLESLTPERVAREAGGFLRAVGEGAAAPNAEHQLTGTLRWLWDAVAAPTLDQLGHAGPVREGEPWPRLWWCVPGLLSLLPLHAAGYHEPQPGAAPRTVVDNAVSSYTPTVRGLAYALRAAPAYPGKAPGPTAGEDQLVVVAMPSTPGAADLYGAEDEAELLRKRFGDRVSILTGSRATHETVLSALPGAARAHFACHGYSDPASPSASRLLLHDHQQRPLTVTDVTRLRLEHADLAFLSACSTAQPGDLLADEAIHLASAFQLAGYRQVIGTLWPIGDLQAVELASDVYDALATAGTGASAAFALHEATRRLRDRWPQNPSIWASHIHAGA